jgi:undecaprenyl-diphosphatase
VTARAQPARARLGRQGPAGALALLAALAVAAFWALATQVDGGAVPGLDRHGFTAGADIRAGWLTSVVKVATTLGSSVVTGPLLMASVAWLLRRRRRLAASALGSGGVAVFAAVHVLKAAIDRPRPSAPLAHTTLASFPSGHAAYSVGYAAIALTLAVGVSRPRAAALSVLALLLALVVGVTRVYLRAHYVTDVLGGWALGVACFAAAGAAAVAVSRMRHNAPSS